jgi:hypothetical protein
VYEQIQDGAAAAGWSPTLDVAEAVVELLPTVADGTEAFAAVAVVTPTANIPAVSTAAGIAFRTIDRRRLSGAETIRSEPLSRELNSMTSPCL